MSRLIDANAITESKELGKKIVVHDMTPYLNVEVLIYFIDSLPTIEAVPVVHGEWIFDKYTAKFGNPYSCSNCNEEFGDTYNFCPNCGSRMNGGSDQ